MCGWPLSQVFLVGAGALGCELIKNFALMGIACDPAGSVTLTDDDIIEKSNLSRQFLFRDWDLKQAKSTAAAKAAIDINPALNVHSQCNRVSPDTEMVFDDDFWGKLDVVVNALDNVNARLYVDSRWEPPAQVPKSCQKSPKVSKSCLQFPKVSKSCLKLPNVPSGVHSTECSVSNTTDVL
jgi:hypothetical protein